MTEKRARILLVDDESELRGILREWLEARGFDVLEAPDGRAALASIERGGIDVVILDLMMPNLNGHDVLRHLAKRSVQLQVIILSAQRSLRDRLRGLYGGAVDYVMKPVEPRELLARVQVAVRQKARLEAARKRANTDALTGLGNRLLFNEVLMSEAKRALRHRRPLALVYADADGLKAVNDSRGHEAGDELLRAIAQALGRTCRQTDIAARIGGDEFAAILPETDREGAQRFLERLSAALAAVSVSASVGLAVLGEDAADADELRLAADRALYAAKRRAVPEL